MPRGSGRSTSRSSSPRRSTTTAQAPMRQPVQQAPAPPVQQAAPRGGFFSNMAGTFVTGMALGAGSEVAHQAVRGIMGSGGSHQQPVEQNEPVAQNQPQTQQQPKQCSDENQSFIQCLQKNSELSFCQMYSDALRECQKKYGF